MSVGSIQAHPHIATTYVPDPPVEAERETDREASAQTAGNVTDYFFALRDRFPGLAFSIGTTPGKEGCNNISLSPVILEKMAADPEVAADYEARLRGLEKASVWLQDHYAAEGLRLKAHGTVIESNGDMHSWVETELPQSSALRPTEAPLSSLPVAEPVTAPPAEETPEAAAQAPPEPETFAATPLPRTLYIPEAAPQTSPAPQARTPYAHYQTVHSQDDVPLKGSLLRIAG